MMYERVRTILAEQLRLEEDEITPDSKIKDDLGADSLDVMQLLMTIEDEYQIRVPDEELANFETVNDVVNYLETLENK